MKTIEIQQALAAKGFKPGPLDGIWGRQTVSALRSFQSSVGLAPDGIIGPLTLEKLFPERPVPTGNDQPSLVWFKEAKRLIGVREDLRSDRSNPIIINWATAEGIKYKGDDIPWCGLFVAHCIGSTLDREQLPGNPLGARQWERFGIPTKPTSGAVMVFWRQSLASGKGHVGFYAGEDDEAYRILGGNQDDSVSLAWINKSRFREARWPSTVAAPMPVAVSARRDEILSWDES